MRAYKFRIYPTEQQKIVLEQTIETCRLLYNECLEERRKERIDYYEQKRGLVSKKRDNEALQRIYAQVLQDVILRLDKTFKRFFNGVSKRPKFKRYGHYNSFTFPQYDKSRIENNRLILPKIGSVKIKFHRPITGKIKTCTIIRDIDRWFACFSVALPECKSTDISKPNDINAVGIDVGLTNWLTLSTGETIDKPKFLSTTTFKRIKTLQKNLSRKKKGSKNREKARLKLAKAWRKVRLQREDYCHKVSSSLAKKYQTVIFEKLTIGQMIKQHHLANSISESTWYKLKRLAAYKAEVIEVDPKNTTQMCSSCGFIPNIRKDLSMRKHECSTCGLVLDRDHNAALNILKKGLGLIGAHVETKPLLILSQKKEHVRSVKQEAV